MQKRKILGLGAGAAAIAGLAAAAIVPAASADGPPTASAGQLILCSFGGYDSQVQFPDRGGWGTYIIPNGQCYTTNAGGNSNEGVNVYDWSTSQNIGSTIYNGSSGETIVTIPGPSFYAFNG